MLVGSIECDTVLAGFDTVLICSDAVSMVMTPVWLVLIVFDCFRYTVLVVFSQGLTGLTRWTDGFNTGLRRVSCWTETILMVLMFLDWFGAHWWFSYLVFNGLDTVLRRVLMFDGHSYDEFCRFGWF